MGLAVRYAGWLADAGVVRGLIGPREVPRLWERHLLNCAALAEAIPAGSRVADIGSGAGLPGLVLAIARPDLHVTLIEPLLRRTTFLEEVRADLELDGVRVVRGRAESMHGVATFDVVTSRAVAALPRLLSWSMPLVAPTGALVAMKGTSVRDEVRQSAADLARWGCAPPRVLELGGPALVPPTTAVVVSWADPAQVSWPASGAVSAPPGAASPRRRPRNDRRSGGRR